ncbi:MAG TPA: hypothetical protein VHX15_04205 [Frankiaceae bacterium]|nr:hypothetical protein [Frankiaceae bacterium]
MLPRHGRALGADHPADAPWRRHPGCLRAAPPLAPRSLAGALPRALPTPPGSSEYSMYRDEAADPPALVCQVGSTTLKYRLSAIDDLHAWLQEQDDWVPPLLEALGLAEVTHDARHNRMRALPNT